MSRQHILITAAVVAAALPLSSCGARSTAGTGTPAPAPLAAAARQAEPVSLTAARIAGLGTILTDQDGMTLYRFDEDSADPPTSTCDGDCAAAWPPLVADGEIVTAGLDDALVGTAPRVDGDDQVTVGGRPLYRFAQDREPGEARGHGVADAWFAVTPDGGRAGVAPGIEARELPGFGPALTDQDGFTLYLFANDSKDPSRSECQGECARTWPPVLVGDTAPEPAGVDPAIVGEVARTDGTRQVTVGGWPVYRFGGDEAPGQANGHGVGGTWFVIEPAGCRSTAPVPERTPDAAVGAGY